MHVTDNEKQAWKYIKTIDSKSESYIRAKIKLKFYSNKKSSTLVRDYKLAYFFFPYFFKQFYLFLWWYYNILKNRMHRYNQGNLSIYKDKFRPKYGNYPLNPSKIKYIYDQSKNNLFIRKFDMNLLFSGKWENKSSSQKVKNSLLYLSAIERYSENKPWYNTSYFKNKISIGVNEKKINSIINHISGLDSLYKEMQIKGYISQKDLSPFFPNAKAIQGWGEVAIHIGEQGDIYLSQGRHRAIFSLLLGIDKIQTNIIARHTKWINFKERIINYLESEGGKIDFPLEHVDLQFIPYKYVGNSINFLKDNLPTTPSKVLLLGDRWGYFSSKLEKLGHECLVYEPNSEHYYFMNNLKIINGNNFLTVNNILELKEKIKNNKYDLVFSFFQFKNFATNSFFKDFLTIINNLVSDSFFFQDLTTNYDSDKANIKLVFDRLISKTSFSHYQKSSKLYDNAFIFQLIR